MLVSRAWLRSGQRGFLYQWLAYTIHNLSTAREFKALITFNYVLRSSCTSSSSSLPAIGRLPNKFGMGMMVKGKGIAEGEGQGRAGLLKDKEDERRGMSLNSEPSARPRPPPGPDCRGPSPGLSPGDLSRALEPPQVSPLQGSASPGRPSQALPCAALATDNYAKLRVKRRSVRSSSAAWGAACMAKGLGHKLCE